MVLAQINNRESIRGYQFSPFLLDVAARCLTRGRQPVPLRDKLFDLLLLLIKNRGQLVTKETLFKELWPDCFVEESNLTVAVSALRKALGESHNKHEYIETVPKRGYRFIAPVRELSGGEIAPREEEDALITSLAVLPLNNTSNNSDLDYLSDGITESLINSFSRLPTLRVMARSTVFRYKGREIDAFEVGSSLQVEAVLTGRMAHLGEHIVIGLELVNCSNGSQIWGEQYKLKFSNIFDVQERIVEEVSHNLRLKLTSTEQQQLHVHQTSDSKAYRDYLKGRHFLGKRTVSEIKKAIDYFQKAIKKDHNYAQAYAGIADCHSLLGSYGVYPEREGFMKARPMIERALELEPDLAEAHAALGYIKVYSWEWSDAESHFQTAIKLQPSYVLAHRWYALLLLCLGRFDQARRELEYCLLLSPLSPFICTSLGAHFYWAREWDLTITWCREALEIDPSNYSGTALLGMAYVEKGMHREAIEVHQSLASLTNEEEVLSLLGYSYSQAGERGEALKIIKRLKKMARRRYIKPYHLALVYVGLGETDSAFEWLERAFEDKNDLITMINLDQRYDALRNDPRMVSLLQKMVHPTAPITQPLVTSSYRRRRDAGSKRSD